MYNVYVCKVKNIRPAENANRLNACEVFGITTIVDKSVNENDLYVYFPTDGQISEEFGKANDLFRRKDENGNPAGGFIDPVKRNIGAIRLRGNKSEGLILPLTCLTPFGDISNLAEGDIVSTFNGHVIAEKYVPMHKPRVSESTARGEHNHKSAKKCRIKYPFFAEHIDTPQLRFNMDMFKPGDIICLTEKVHGTSSRNAYQTAIVGENGFFLTKLIAHSNWLPKKWRMSAQSHLTPKTEMRYLIGTRRTVLTNNSTGGFYGNDDFRKAWGERFKGKLLPNEECFGEIAGFYKDNYGGAVPIMSRGDNTKTKDKQFIKQYGKTTTFSYGCTETGYYTYGDGTHEERPLNRYFVYRMTYTTPEGVVIEYPWDLVKQRAEQMGFETVPELERFIYTTEEDFLARIAKYEDIPSTIDSSHVIEGVVIRKMNGTRFDVAKDKSYNFKVLENLIKVDAEVPDMEEIEEEMTLEDN
jgi:hypothetical protein